LEWVFSLEWWHDRIFRSIAPDEEVREAFSALEQVPLTWLLKSAEEIVSEVFAEWTADQQSTLVRYLVSLAGHTHHVLVSAPIRLSGTVHSDWIPATPDILACLPARTRTATN